MVKSLLCGAALAAAMLPVAASAQLGNALDCAADRAEPPFRNLLAEALIGDGDNLGFERLLGQFSIIADSCTAGFALDAAQKKAYLDYGVSRILREWLTSRLASYGLSASTIDTALDFGPGRSNPRLSGEMSEEQVRILIQAFIESGVDTEALGAPAWESVGTYAAVSSNYWRQRQQLSAWTVTPPSLVAVSEPARPAPVAPAAGPEPVVAAPPVPAPVREPAPEPVIATPPPVELNPAPAPAPEPGSEPAIATPPPAEAAPAPSPEPAPPA